MHKVLHYDDIVEWQQFRLFPALFVENERVDGMRKKLAD